MTPQTELRSGFKHDDEYELGNKALDEFAAEGDRDLAAEGERGFTVEGERVFRVEREPDLEVEREPDFGPQGEPDELPMWVVADSTPEVRPRPIVEPRVQARRWPIFIPLAVGVIAVSAGYGLASRDVGLPVLPTAPARWATAGRQLAPIPVPELPPSAIVRDAVGGSLQASGATAQASGAPSGDTAAAGDLVQASGGPLRAAVDEALAGVSRSFRALDAASLTQVWPDADVAGLSRRFSALKYQSLSFDRCDPRPVGRQIVASCQVSIAAAANAGDPALQRRRESWSIVFDRSGDRYVIGSVTTR